MLIAVQTNNGPVLIDVQNGAPETHAYRAYCHVHFGQYIDPNSQEPQPPTAETLRLYTTPVAPIILKD